MNARTQRIVSLLGMIVLAVLLSTVALAPRTVVHASSSVPIGGWAWSDNIGWISMSGSGYGLQMDTSGGATDGDVTGYAWSDSVGWISANSSDIAGCASGATSHIDGTTGTWSGWLRAVAGESDPGGWDGCIEMSDPGGQFTTTYNQSTGALGGYAWGSTVVGWIDMSKVSTQASCTTFVPPTYCGSGADANKVYEKDTFNNTCLISDCAANGNVCSDGACTRPSPIVSAPLAVQPSVVASGGITTVSWDVQNVQTCTVKGTNSDIWTVAGSGSTNESAGSFQSSAIVQQTVYTLTCTALDGSLMTPSQTATVNVIPTYREI